LITEPASPYEKDIAEAVARTIEDGTFLQHTDGLEQLGRILGNVESPDVIPVLSVDHHVRRRLADAAQYVLKSFGKLERVSFDQNISGAAGTLRPDILAFDHATGVLLCFELKRSVATGREALTELLAYEQEIRNHLPLTSRDTVAFVLMSTMWSPILDHAAA
jgi:hypothetical protein